MSAPIGTICTSFSAILFLASSARSSTMPVDWMPIFLPTMSCGLRTGFFFSEKNVYGCCCAPTAKHLIGMSCETASMIDGLDDTCADLEAAGRDDRDAVDVRAAGLDAHIDAFLLVDSPGAWRTTSPIWLPPGSQPSCMLTTGLA